MILKVGIQHWILEYYQICSNDDPEMTLAYFTAKSNLVPYAFVWEKGKTIFFRNYYSLYDMEVDRCSQLNEYTKLCENQKSRSFNDLGPNHSDSIFLNFFSSITTWPIEAKFYVESPWDEGTKACSNCLGHMTKMATMPYMVTSFKNLLLWNLKADDFETWYAAPHTRVLPRFFKCCPGLTLTYFTARSNLVLYAFV